MYIFDNHRGGLVARDFTTQAGDQGLIPGQVIPKTLKRVQNPLCLTLSIQNKIGGKGSSEQAIERSHAHPKPCPPRNLPLPTAVGNLLTYICAFNNFSHASHVDFYILTPVSSTDLSKMYRSIIVYLITIDLY